LVLKNGEAGGGDMPKKGLSEEQIVGALQRVESGEKVGAVSRGLGISQATYYAWKRRYAGLGVTE
jgi:putative transposase